MREHSAPPPFLPEPTSGQMHIAVDLLGHPEAQVTPGTPQDLAAGSDAVLQLPRQGGSSRSGMASHKASSLQAVSGDTEAGTVG